MGRKRSPSRPPAPSPAARSGLTGERLVRLYQLVRLLGTAPQTRAALTRRLGLDVRGFYRDLRSLRSVGIEVVSEGSRYTLDLSLSAAMSLLPLPDPQLTYGEALTLAKGRTAAHRKLKKHLEQLRG